MFPQGTGTIPWTELPPANPKSPLAEEWETYRREVGRLLAQGLEGKFVLIRGTEIVGAYETWAEARETGLERFGSKPHMVRPVFAKEPILRGPPFMHPCPS